MHLSLQMTIVQTRAWDWVSTGFGSECDCFWHGVHLLQRTSYNFNSTLHQNASYKLLRKDTKEGSGERVLLLLLLLSSEINKAISSQIRRSSAERLGGTRDEQGDSIDDAKGVPACTTSWWISKRETKQKQNETTKCLAVSSFPHHFISFQSIATYSKLPYFVSFYSHLFCSDCNCWIFLG